MVFQFGQIEIRACPARELFLRVVPEEEPEIKQRSRHGIPVDNDMLLRQMPAARAHKQDGQGGVQLVVFLGRRIRVGDRPPNGIAQVYMALDEVAPRRRVGVFKIPHEDVGPRIQSVDDHFAIDGAGDLDPAIQQIRGQRSHRPVRLADFGCLRQKIRTFTGIEFRLPSHTGGQQLPALGAKPPLQIHNKF